ncbi:MAG: molybdopterin-guanine dinucleotide biosynthesis protein MobB [Candidatus Hydrothermarchaeaceae archaeon]
MHAIAVVGSGRRAGKTTTVESLVRELTRRGKKVGTIKQIHEKDFTLDTKRKDTWRHADAGARIVATAAPHEVAALKRIDGDRLNEAMKFLKGADLDIVIIEGNPRRELPIIFASGNVEKAKNTKKILKGVKGKLICISAFEPGKFDKSDFSVPVFHPTKDAKGMADLVEKFLSMEDGPHV